MDFLIIFAAKYLIIVPVAAALYYAWKMPVETRRRYLLIAAISLPVAYAIAKIGSYFYYNARPFVESGIAPLIPHVADNGFPSDHTLLAAAIAAVITVFDKRLGIVLWLAVLAIGGARVVAGIHHSTDIIGSMLIAAAVTFAVTFFVSKRAG